MTQYIPLCGHFSDDVLPIYAAKRKILKSIRIFCLCDFFMTDAWTHWHFFHRVDTLIKVQKAARQIKV